MQIRLAPPQEVRCGLDRLIDDLQVRQDAAPFGEVILSAMARPGGAGIGVAGEQEGRLAAYGFAEPNPDGRAWTLEVAADSACYGPFLRETMDRLAARGVAEVVLWIHTSSVEPPPDLMSPERHLLRMTVELPVPDGGPPPDGVVIRELDPDRDAEALLELNNRAFAGHPEQGGWTAGDLRMRMARPWFDPCGVRTAWVGDRMGAFHWTKIHPDEGGGGGPVGEIYAIAVDPSYQGRGLGRAIAVDGLRYLACSRGAETAILYVDASNARAVGMYRSMGFVTEEVHRAYRWTGNSGIPSGGVDEGAR